MARKGRHLVSPQPPRVFHPRFLNSRFPHYLGAWNRLFLNEMVKTKKNIKEQSHTLYLTLVTVFCFFFCFCQPLRSTKETVPSITVQEPLADVFSWNVVEWPNPLGIENKLLHRFFEYIWILYIDLFYVRKTELLKQIALTGESKVTTRQRIKEQRQQNQHNNNNNNNNSFIKI